LAEGEELGSNLLRVAQSSLGDPGGLGSFGKGAGAPNAPRSETGDGCTGLPGPAASQSADPRSARPTSATAPHPLSNALIDRIREPGGGLTTSSSVTRRLVVPTHGGTAVCGLVQRRLRTAYPYYTALETQYRWAPCNWGDRRYESIFRP
jgi:hypothetical protein